MNVASLELCKELYELSGWEADYSWATNGSGLDFIVRSDDKELGHDIARTSYAYDLGYLLRKLPNEPSLHSLAGYWVAYSGKAADGNQVSERADTPEDAACKLAIELFKQGILNSKEASTKGGER